MDSRHLSSGLQPKKAAPKKRCERSISLVLSQVRVLPPALKKTMSKYSEYISEIEAICTGKGYDFEKIVVGGKPNQFDPGRVVINPYGKKTIFFYAGIHGDEISGPHAVLEFLKAYSAEDYPKSRVVIIPVANPKAFEKRKRGARDDINRGYEKRKLSGLRKVLFDCVMRYEPQIFHGIHEDPDDKYVFAFSYGNENVKLCKELLSMFVEKFGVQLYPKEEFMNSFQKEGWHYQGLCDGLVLDLVDGSIENRVYEETNNFTVTTESPGASDLEIRKDICLFAMYFLINKLEKGF